MKDTINTQKTLIQYFEKRIKMKDKTLKRIRLQHSRNVAKINKLNNEIGQIAEQIDDVRSVNARLETDLANKERELQAKHETMSNMEEERDCLADMLNESQSVSFYDSIEGKYSYELRQCIYTLLSLNVSAQNVEHVIKCVLKIVGKQCEKLPARSTVLNMNVERLILSQTQLGEVIPDKTNLTLYTDETSKFGTKYSGYHVSDQDGHMYVLGMRQLETKSAKDTLNAFEVILEDIKDKTKDTNSVAKKILLKITSTMSDRASTEKKFNTLLQELRAQVLPELHENWDELSHEEQTSVSTLLNFFCGLHSLVHFADTCNASLNELEKAHFENETPIFDKKFFKSSESGVVRFIRTTCKALARGADEKSGKFKDFSVFVKQFLKDHKLYSLPLEEFRGNRFNILFESAAGVFFLKDKIEDFLNGNHQNNLLKAVLHDVRVPFFLAEVKALGLVSRLITGPLWCLLEDRNIHILDMNRHYLELVNFFDDALRNIDSFMKGRLLPFGESTALKRDPLFAALLEDWEHDDKVVVCLNVVLPALCKLAKHIFMDHLPGGRWDHVTEETRRRSTGTLAHNKFSESVFGYLDTLLRMKPNISVLASEAFIMFSANKTNMWLDSKSETDKDKLIQAAMKDVGRTRENYKRRAEEIAVNQKLRVEQSIQEAEAAETRRLSRLEGYSKKMIHFGLWQSEEEVESALNEITKKTEKLDALKAQLNFRRHVLKQNPEDTKCYLLSVDKRKLTIEEVKANVIKLVNHAFTIQQPVGSKPEQPILTGKRVQHSFEEDGESKWFKGKVISQVPGYPEYYNITYDGDTAVYVFKLLEDYSKG